jgi:YHS domain-containing protein
MRRTIITRRKSRRLPGMLPAQNKPVVIRSAEWRLESIRRRNRQRMGSLPTTSVRRTVTGSSKRDPSTLRKSREWKGATLHEHGSNLAKDPVCGMSVSAQTKHRYVHDGVEFLFCSARCRERFIENPKNFHPTVAPQEPVAIQKTSAAEWTCPMHPEIVRPEPGSCPICGMSLEPRTITLQAAGDAELRSMTRRFWFASALTLPLLVVVMSDMLPGHPVSGLFPPRLRVLLELVLASPVCIWAAWPFYVRAFNR